MACVRTLSTQTGTIPFKGTGTTLRIINGIQHLYSHLVSVEGELQRQVESLEGAKVKIADNSETERFQKQRDYIMF